MLREPLLREEQFSVSLIKEEMSVRELLRWAVKTLESLGPDEASASAERLLTEVIGCRKHDLYLCGEEAVSSSAVSRYQDFIRFRKERVPVAYILGFTEFWDEKISVRPGCLIPRPETECLIEAVLRINRWSPKDSFDILDLAAGSGAVGISLLRLFPKANAVFSDLSNLSLEMVRENLNRYSLLNRAQIVQSDLFQSLFPQKWDVIVSNPPYLSKKDMGQLQPELKYEPAEALYGGEDGLEFYRKISGTAGSYLKFEGCLILEVGQGQAGEVCRMLQQKGLTVFETVKDSLGIDRVISARKA